MKKKIIIAIIVLILIIVLYSLVVKYFYPEMSDRGLFGDMFGGINAIFSGLAFLGVIYTILLQSKELKLQREELELTRKELKRTAEAQEKSEKALLKQVDSLKQNAKLNGLGSILRHKDALMEAVASGKYGISSIHPPLKEDAERTIKQIEDIVAGKK